MDNKEIKKEEKIENKSEPEVVEEFVPEDGEGNEMLAKDKLKALREELKKCKAEKAEYLAGWQKERADSINRAKKDAEEKKDFVKFANEDLMTELISALDSFDMAIGSSGWEKSDKNWRLGIEHIYNQLLQTLGNFGMEQVKPINGEKLEHSKHEATELVPTKNKYEDETILAVIQKGYILNGRVIRAAKVKVGEYADN